MTDVDDIEYEDVTGYVAAAREDEGRPPGFRMHGETFICEPVLRARAMLDLAVLPRVEGRVASLYGFLHDTLTAESWERFEVLFDDRDRPVDVTMLDAAVGAVLEQYTGRPTRESSSSATTPRKRGKSSKGGSSSRERDLRSA